jgi:hypothetical protein
MPPKRTQRKKSEPRLPRFKPLQDDVLDEWMNTLVKVFTVTGGCLTGRLIKYDHKSLIISPKTCVQRKHIVSLYQANNAPDKQAARPPVHRHGNDGT